MEQSPRSLILQRRFAALLLAGVAAAAWRQARSPLAQSLRENRPWAGWLVLTQADSEAPRLYLAVAQPARSILTLFFIPEQTKLSGRGTPRSTYEAAYKKNPDAHAAAQAMADAVTLWLQTLDAGFDWSGLPLFYEKAPLESGDWPLPLQGKSRLLGLKLLPRPRGLSRFDALLLALELRRLPAKAVHAAFLAPEAAAAALLETALSPRRRGAPGPEERDLAVEVLNATQKIGIATQAKKVLRWKGADVVATGNAEAPRERTLIYDRLGRIENADAVRRMLDCPSAETLTAVDSGRAVDVTVVLAEDCPLR
mgnify:FL=1